MQQLYGHHKKNSVYTSKIERIESSHQNGPMPEISIIREKPIKTKIFHPKRKRRKRYLNEQAIKKMEKVHRKDLVFFTLRKTRKH